MNLSNWLRKTPQPAFVMADDKKIEVQKNHRAYRDLTQTIKSLEPSKLTCLDANGNVLRSITLGEDEPDKAVVAASPEMSDLQLFARLLAEGYERGAQSNAPLVDRAMDFVERQGVRLARAESEIERLRALNLKLHHQIAELNAIPVVEAPQEGSSDSIMGAIVAGALQGQLSAMQQQGAVTPLKTGAKSK